MEQKCIFCHEEEALLQNELAWARYDKYQVSPGQLLIITRRHVQSYFDTTPKELVHSSPTLTIASAYSFLDIQ
jgi:diadenosine tetraphosphate (Ap4A) HIT family hydrolase